MIYNEKKISEISRLGWHESVRIFVMRRVRNNGSCFSHFFELFAGGLAPGLAGCLQGKSRLYFYTSLLPLCDLKILKIFQFQLK